MTGEPGFEIAPESAFHDDGEHSSGVDEGSSSRFKNKRLLFAVGVASVLVVIMLVAPILLKKPPPQMPPELIGKASAPPGQGVESIRQPSALPLPAIADGNAPGPQSGTAQAAGASQVAQQRLAAVAQAPGVPTNPQPPPAGVQAQVTAAPVQPVASEAAPAGHPTENSPAAVRRAEPKHVEGEASPGETVAELRARIALLEAQLKGKQDTAKSRRVVATNAAAVGASRGDSDGRPKAKARRSSETSAESDAPAFSRYQLKQVTVSEAWIEDQDGNMLVLSVGGKLPTGTKIVSINADNGSVVLDRGGALKIR